MEQSGSENSPRDKANEHTYLLKAFIGYEKARGIRALKRIPSDLASLFFFLKEKDIQLLSLKCSRGRRIP